MPLYEYRCTDCENKVEVIQRFSDPDLSDCTECGGTLERLLSAPSIRFKGSGWYVNDYAAKGKNGTSKSTKDPEKNVDKSPKAKPASKKQ